MKHLTSYPRRFIQWIGHSHKNFLIAAVAASAVVFSVSTFAAAPPKKATASCSAGIVAWAEKNGWKDPSTYQCKVDLSIHKFDAQPGSVAPGEFTNVKQLTKFINSDSAKARAFNKAAKDSLSKDQYKAWKSGKYFTPVQFKEDAVIDTNTALSGGTVIYTANANRRVQAGDVVFAFVYKGKVTTEGNVRMDCGNPRVGKVRPKTPQHPPVKKPPKKTPKKPGKLVVVKFEDTNGNAKLDTNEKRMKDVSFTIEGQKTQKTDAKGTISVSKLKPDVYDVTEKLPAGYKNTTELKQSARVESGKTKKVYFGNQKLATPVVAPSPTPPAPVVTPTPPEVPPVTTTVTPPPVTPTPPIVCTENGTLKISGYIDTNANGVRDTNEQPKVGVRFTLKKSNAPVDAPAEKEGTTDTQGSTVIKDLEPATYAVTEDTPTAYVAVQKTQTVTIVNCQEATLTFVNQPTPQPAVQPEIPVVTEKSAIAPVQQAVGSLPQTGQAGVLGLATFAGLAALYFGVHFARRRKK